MAIDEGYSTTKGRIAQAIFILCLIAAIIIPIGTIMILVAEFIVEDYYNSLSYYILLPLLSLVVSAVLIGIGWGMRWLITGRSDKRII